MNGVRGMSKPTLGQIVELNKMHELALGIWKDGQYHYVFNEDVVTRFGDVEIHDLSVELFTSRDAKSEKVFRPRFEVIL